MSAIDFDRALRDWLSEGPTQPPTEVVNRALRDARRMGQARTISWPWTDLPSTTRRPMALLTTAMAAVMVVAVVALGVWSVLPPIPPATVPPAVSPSPSMGPSASLAPTPSLTEEPSPIAEPTSSHTDQPASPTRTPTTTFTPSPPPFSIPPDTSWREITAADGIPTQELIQGAVSFTAGYVATGLMEEASSDISWSWASADGETWMATRLSQTATCPAADGTADETVRLRAGSGDQVLLLGTTQCGEERSVSWLTQDGLNWQRSDPFGGLDSPAAVWAVAGGWEALLGDFDTGSTLWTSSDGLSWQRGTVVSRPGAVAYDGTAAPDGTRLIAVVDESTSSTSLQASSDGFAWRTVRPNAGSVKKIIVPASEGAPWLVAYGDDNVDVWASTDLVNWQTSLSFAPGFVELAATRYGYMASGVDACPPADTQCDPNDAESFSQYLSGDGLGWLPFSQAFGTAKRNHFIVDGPAGVIAIEFGAGGVRLWRLGP
jgi:hypothetical protein